MSYRRSPGPADGSHLPAASAAAEEPIATIRFQPRHTYSRWHFEPLQDLSRLRIDATQIAFFVLQRRVPEFAIDPGNPCNKAIGLNGAKNFSCLWIDLVDLPVPILPHPQRPFRPGEPRTGTPRRRYRGEYLARIRINLLNVVIGKLKQMVAVEGRSCVRGDNDSALDLSIRRSEGVQPVAGRKPDVLAVKCYPIDPVGAGERAIFAEDFGS